MALLYRTPACVISLMLCLCCPSTASQALQHHHGGQGMDSGVRTSLEGEIEPSSRQGVAGVQVTATARVAASDATTAEEDQNDGLTETPTWTENRKRESLEVHTNLKENMTRKTTGGGKGDATTNNEENKAGKKEKINPSHVWFTDTLNVTTRPVVTWSHRAANRHLSPVTATSRKGDVEDEEEEKEEDDEETILLTVTFIKEGHPLILDLHPTRDLLAASYKESSGGANGNDTLPGERRAMPCEYQGVVRGDEETWVAMSVCDGLSGVVSVTLDGGEEVELLVEPSPGSTSPHQPHRVFSSTLLSLPARACGVKDTDPAVEVEDDPSTDTTDGERMTNASFSSLRRARRGVGLRGEALWFQKNTRFVELVVVADHSYYLKHGDRTRRRCRAIVNIVNAVYRPLGVVVVLSHLEVWEDHDKIEVTADHTQNLELFKKYRKMMKEEKPDYNNDNTMLLTDVDFIGNTVGYAGVSVMCGIEASAGVVQDKQKHEGVVAYTLSHEMGHNFGMTHDGQTCQCTTKSCIMSSSSSPNFEPGIGWSSCSRQVIKDNLNSESYECLMNVPGRMYPTSTCGDGVVDDSEQCDCGPPEFCDNRCCVAATCRFAVNASCASGPCCDTKKCQLKPRGAVCRAAFTECDLPEFCSGNFEACPRDVTKAIGTPCHGGQGYCYEAKCGSHEGQCQVMWGRNARVADLACYSKLNTRGGTNGNCGFRGSTKTDLLPCADRDELCGSLQCLPQPNAKPQLKVAVNYGTFPFPHHSCSYIVSSDRISGRYWLTPDGAKCADGKMCLNQKCMNVPDPAGHCRQGCSGHGVCNSRNHCHCDSGFAPPDCSKEGLGGSIDSFHIEHKYKDPLKEVAFIVFLIALGAASVTCCLWSHIRRWWEARGRARVPPYCARCLDVCCCPLMSLITDRLCTKTNNENVSQEAQDPLKQDKMICQVDLNLKDNQSHTNSLPSNHSVQQPMTVQKPDHPTYLQSVSVDSGCISDAEDTTVQEPYDSRMSMKSLVSVFKEFGTRSSPSPTERENSPTKTYQRQRSMPLHRTVVDPLAENHRSRQSSAKGRPNGAPSLTPPATKKPYKNKDKSPQVCRSTTQRVACQMDVRPYNNGQTVPPTHGNRNPPRPSPVRVAPTPPSAPSSAPRKPMMPPGTKQTSLTIKTPPKNEFPAKAVSPVGAPQQKGKNIQNSPLKRPIMPPVRGPVTPPAALLHKSSAGSSKPRAPGDEAPPSKGGGRVKDLAKKLENQ